jgi:alpha-amylase/alpha-mannosidase (GH57 family)
VSTRHFQHFCVHGHFYQPPRGNPITGHIGFEPEAGDYRNWNERITAEAYRPNAEIGNFDRISFDIGEPLLSWLRRRAPETYQRILEADRNNLAAKKVGNAVGSVFHHAILPLLKRRDKRTLFYWGYVAFQHHFGRAPEGVWLPEMAVDLETLQMAEASGYRYTILSQGQINEPVENAGPFWVDLENGRRLAVFVRNDELSDDLSFNVSAAGGAGHWARNKLGVRRASGLTLVAVGGETFGHHHLGEERFLHWLLAHEAPAIGYRVVTLNEYLKDFSPNETVTVKPFTAYSARSVSQWSLGWKGYLLRALDHLSAALDELYVEVMRPLNVNVWRLRDLYVNVWLKHQTGEQFLAEFAPALTSEQQTRLLTMLNAQFYMGKSYTSNSLEPERFDSPETRFGIANAALVVKLVEQATGEQLGSTLRNNLLLVADEISGLNGAQVYDSVLEEFRIGEATPATSIEPVPEQLTDSTDARAESA